MTFSFSVLISLYGYLIALNFLVLILSIVLALGLSIIKRDVVDPEYNTNLKRSTSLLELAKRSGSLKGSSNVLIGLAYLFLPIYPMYVMSETIVNIGRYGFNGATNILIARNLRDVQAATLDSSAISYEIYETAEFFLDKNSSNKTE